MAFLIHNAFATIAVSALTASIVFVTSSPIHAQKQATTVFALAKRTPLVLHVRVTDRRESGGTLRISFTTLEALRGTPSVALELEELGAHHCGAACHGLEVGSRLILFAAERDGQFHVRGGSRGLLHESDERLALVRKLVAEPAPAALIRLVTDALDSEDSRIAEDAALALPTLPELERMKDDDRVRLERAVETELRAPSTRLFGLLTASTRVSPKFAARAAWSLWLEPQRESWHSVAKCILIEEVPVQVTTESVDFTSLDVAGRRRTAVLFQGVRSEAHGGPLLRRLASDIDAGVRAEAVAALLLRGTDPGAVAPDTRRAADAIVERERGTRYRAIRQKPRR
ncbi:MAG: hypothetical protein H6832_05340 [Planctomycetes bacterium]|nr:hypothetical protein [Planctomycetota bacterium]MCB9917806.1 hypothetical protein [Planctomycetota bacterium]